MRILKAVILIIAFLFSCGWPDAPAVNLVKTAQLQRNTPESILTGTITSGSDIIAGAQNCLYISTDNGLTWDRDFGPDNYFHSFGVNSICINNTGTIYAANAGIAVSRNNGSSWSIQNEAQGLGGSFIGDIVHDTAGNVYAATSGGLSKTENDGLSWITNPAFQPPLEGQSINSMAIAANQTLYLGAYSGLFSSVDGGDTWNTVRTADFHVADIYCSSAGGLYIATDTGISVTLNNGVSWLDLGSADGLSGNQASAVFVDSSGVIYVSAFDVTDYTIYGKGLSVSLDNGTSWSTYTISDGLPDNYIPVLFSAGTRVYAGGNSGLSYSDNNGITWIPVRENGEFPGNNVRDVVKDSQGRLFAATTSGIGSSSDNGQTWRYISMADGLPHNFVYTLAVDAADYLYAGTPRGLSVSSNAGTSWTNYSTVDGLHTNDIYAVYSDGAGTIYCGGYAGGISISSDYGLSWTNLNSASTPAFNASTVNSICSDSQGNVYAGTGNGLLIKNTNNFSWSRISGGDHDDSLIYYYVNDVYVNSENWIYVGTYKGCSVSDDGGATWENNMYNNDFETVCTTSEGSFFGGGFRRGLGQSVDHGYIWSYYFEYDQDGVDVDIRELDLYENQLFMSTDNGLWLVTLSY